MNLMLWVITDIGLLLAGFMAGRAVGQRRAGRAVGQRRAGRAVGQRRAVKALVFMPDSLFEETISLTRQARECQKIRDENVSNSEDK